MSKKTNAVPPAISLDEISALSVNDAADGFAKEYTVKTRAFVAMGKYAFHLMNRVKLPKGQTLYGIMQKRGVPQGSVNNALLVEKFISAFVITGLVTEARADEIITFRVVNQCARIMGGKSAVTMTPEELAPLLNEGNKAAIGDELDSLQEHGLTIAGREEAEKAKQDEEARIAAANEAAAKLPQQVAAPEPAAPAASPAAPQAAAPAETGDAPAAEAQDTGNTAPEAVAPETPPANTIPIGTGSSHAARPTSAAEIMAEIAAIELKSYDLTPDEQEAVCVKLGDWISLLSACIQNEKKQTEAAA
jgi:hypothetical protein